MQCRWQTLALACYWFVVLRSAAAQGAYSCPTVEGYVFIRGYAVTGGYTAQVVNKTGVYGYAQLCDWFHPSVCLGFTSNGFFLGINAMDSSGFLFWYEYPTSAMLALGPCLGTYIRFSSVFTGCGRAGGYSMFPSMRSYPTSNSRVFSLPVSNTLQELNQLSMLCDSTQSCDGFNFLADSVEMLGAIRNYQDLLATPDITWPASSKCLGLNVRFFNSTQPGARTVNSNITKLCMVNNTLLCQQYSNAPSMDGYWIISQLPTPSKWNNNSNLVEVIFRANIYAAVDSLVDYLTLTQFAGGSIVNSLTFPAHQGISDGHATTSINLTARAYNVALIPGLNVTIMFGFGATQGPEYPFIIFEGGVRLMYQSNQNIPEKTIPKITAEVLNKLPTAIVSRLDEEGKYDTSSRATYLMQQPIFVPPTDNYSVNVLSLAPEIMPQGVSSTGTSLWLTMQATWLEWSNHSDNGVEFCILNEFVSDEESLDPCSHGSAYIFSPQPKGQAVQQFLNLEYNLSSHFAPIAAIGNHTVVPANPFLQELDVGAFPPAMMPETVFVNGSYVASKTAINQPSVHTLNQATYGLLDMDLNLSKPIFIGMVTSCYCRAALNATAVVDLIFVDASGAPNTQVDEVLDDTDLAIVIAVVVPVVTVLIGVLGVLGFMLYRRRQRQDVARKADTGNEASCNLGSTPFNNAPHLPATTLTLTLETSSKVPLSCVFESKGIARKFTSKLSGCSPSAFNGHGGDGASQDVSHRGPSEQLWKSMLQRMDYAYHHLAGSIQMEDNRQTNVVDNPMMIDNIPSIMHRSMHFSKLPLMEHPVLPDVDLNIKPAEIEVEGGAEQLLGAGAFGSVYQAWYKHSPVAVKVINQQGTAPMSEEELRTLQQEVEILARLRHPNVVRLLGASLEPSHMFFVMELMTCSLSELLYADDDYGPLTMKRKLELALDTARGLNFLHPGIVHRDLKPANILIGRNGQAKISDFGLARTKYHAYLSTKQPDMGTVAYMAPECFNPDIGGLSTKCDIYSFGVLLWEILTETAPWVGESNVTIIFRVAIQGTRLPLPQPPHPACELPGLLALINDCWAQQPADRPSCSEILARLEQLLEHVSCPWPMPVSHTATPSPFTGALMSCFQNITLQEMNLDPAILHALPPAPASGAITPTGSNVAITNPTFNLTVGPNMPLTKMAPIQEEPVHLCSITSLVADATAAPLAINSSEHLAGTNSGLSGTPASGTVSSTGSGLTDSVLGPQAGSGDEYRLSMGVGVHGFSVRQDSPASSPRGVASNRHYSRQGGDSGARRSAAALEAAAAAVFAAARSSFDNPPTMGAPPIRSSSSKFFRALSEGFGSEPGNVSGGLVNRSSPSRNSPSNLSRELAVSLAQAWGSDPGTGTMFGPVSRRSSPSNLPRPPMSSWLSPPVSRVGSNRKMAAPVTVADDEKQQCVDEGGNDRA